MSQAPHTTAIVVTYNSMATIDRTLRAAQASVEADELSVVVVDNASQDGTADHVRSNYPWVTLIDHGGNYGFARGCNRGFEDVSTPYALFLNPDAELGQDGLGTLHEFMESHPDCGACAPALVYPDGSPQLAGMMATPGVLIRKALGGEAPPQQRKIEPGSEPFQTNWVCGAVFLIRSDLYRAVGMMDPRYFLYFEETDLWRVVDSHGFSIWAIGQAVAQHEGAGSSKSFGLPMENGCIAEHYYRSRFYFLTKNFGLFAAVGTEAIEFGMFLLRTLVRRVRGRPSQSLRERLSGGLFLAPKQPSKALPVGND